MSKRYSITSPWKIIMTSRAPRQSADEWFQIITEFNRSSVSVEEFCSRRGYALSTFSRWRLRFSKQHPDQARSGAIRSQAAFVEALPRESNSVTITLNDCVRVDCPLSVGVEQISRLAKSLAADERV